MRYVSACGSPLGVIVLAADEIGLLGLPGIMRAWKTPSKKKTGQTLFGV